MFNAALKLTTASSTFDISVGVFILLDVLVPVSLKGTPNTRLATGQSKSLINQTFHLHPYHFLHTVHKLMNPSSSGEGQSPDVITRQL